MEAQDKPKLDAFSALELGIAGGSNFTNENIGLNSYYQRKDLVIIPSVIFRREWPISHKVYAGLGTGYEYVMQSKGHSYEALDVNGTIKFEKVETPGSHYHFIPVYGQGKFYFRDDTSSGYVYADLGSFIKLDNNPGKSVLLWGLGIGQRYKVASGTWITCNFDYHEHYIHYRNQQFDEPNPNPRIAALSLKVGLMFY
ncbi:MAG: hypothetical protein ACKOWL_01155 [Sphingobacteriaceae bacterium]